MPVLHRHFRYHHTLTIITSSWNSIFLFLKSSNHKKTQPKTFFFLPETVDGDWGQWGPWSGAYSGTCGQGVVVRNRTCDNPAPMYNGKNCTGNEQETKPCDTGVNCPRKFGFLSFLL